MTRALVACVALTACGPTAELGWTLQDDGVIIVTERRQTTTRTPLGVEEVTLNIQQLWRVTQSGVVGVDDVSWREEVIKWDLSYSDLGGTFIWEMGSGAPLPEALLALGPSQPREVFVGTSGDVRVAHLGIPEPDEAAKKAAPPPRDRWTTTSRGGLRRARAPETNAPIPWTRDDRVYTWVVGFTHAPQGKKRRGAGWSWQSSREVTPKTSATTTSAWTFDSVDSGTALVREHMTLEGSPPPSEGHFQTTRLSGGADLRLDTRTHSLVSYSARYEADIASPSSRGTALRISEISLEVQ
jgi:hypothetical protein